MTSKLSIEEDGGGNQFIRVGNIRVTLVHRQDGWAGPGDYLRVQAYREPQQTPCTWERSFP